MADLTTTTNQVHRSYPVYDACCGGSPTTIERTCNVPNVLCGIFCTLCWSLSKYYKAQDINCYDAKHSCGKCNRSVGAYTAC